MNFQRLINRQNFCQWLFVKTLLQTAENKRVARSLKRLDFKKVVSANGGFFLLPISVALVKMTLANNF